MNGAPTNEQAPHQHSLVQGKARNGGDQWCKRIQEIAADHAIHPIQMRQWKRQLLDGASELVTRSSKSKEKEGVQARKAKLFQQINRLKMELEWLKKSQLL
jgi:transposase-like protein